MMWLAGAGGWVIKRHDRPRLPFFDLTVENSTVY